MSHQFTARSITSTFLTIVFLIACLASVYIVRHVLLLFFVSFILASALHPTVEKFQAKFRIPRAMSVLLLNLAFVSVIVLLVLWVIPPLITQSLDLYKTLSTYFQLPIIHFDRLSIRDLSQVSQTLVEYEQLFRQFGQSWSNVLTMLNSAFTTVLIVVTALLITSYMLLDFNGMCTAYAWLLPGSNRKEQQAKASKLLQAVRHELGSWIRARGIVMLIIGFATYVFLSILGLPYALPLALLSGVLEIIPNIGPLLSAIPAVAVAFMFVNPWSAGITIGFFAVLQQLENSFITPQVMKKTIDVHPLMTIFLIMIGYELMGVMGSLLSLPLFISFRAVAKEVWPNKGPFSN